MAAAVVKNAVVSATFRDIITEAGVAEGCDRTVGNLLYSLASDNQGQPGPELRAPIIQLITSGKIKTPAQVKAALTHVLKLADNGSNLDLEALKKSCGVGVEYTSE